MDDHPLDTPPPSPLLAIFTGLNCPGCHCQLTGEIDRAKMRLNPHILTCKSDGCRHHGQRWHAPHINLEPA